MSETDRVTLDFGKDHGTAKEDEGTLGDKAKKEVASRNWTWALTCGAVIAGIALIVTGIISVIPSLSTQTLNPGHYIVCGYLVVFGALLILVLVPFPQTWNRLTLKWVPFLHTFRGRGLFMIFMGGLCMGLGVTGICLGILVIVIGVAHFVLACWFRNTLAPSKDFDEQAEQRKLGKQITQEEMAADFKQEAQKQAWENREAIASTAWENRETIAKIGTFVNN